jgi:hypothetical protein
MNEQLNSIKMRRIKIPTKLFMVSINGLNKLSLTQISNFMYYNNELLIVNSNGGEK